MKSSTTKRRQACVLALLVAAGLALPGHAEDQKLEDVFGGLGSARKVGDADENAVPEAQRPGEGTIRGRVFDRGTGVPVAGATVIVMWPMPAGGAEPRQEVQVSDADGAFEFPSIPPGRYSLSFVKSGYRASKMTDFAVQPGVVNRADFPLQPQAIEPGGQVLELEAFVVEAATVEEIMAELELRMDSDSLLNVMSEEDFSRYAASDVGDALKRVAGVNVVEGQFAIIRGLEDRYSSTLYNGAPVPSPDPDRQSVQLDLFPSDVVGNLVVSKTFAPDLPSNSSGGSIDIVTHDYPDGFELKLGAGSGFEENAVDRFLAFNDGSPMGSERDGSDVIESDFGASLGGRRELLGRELRFKGVLSREVDYRTKLGTQENREPRATLNVVDTSRPPVIIIVPGQPPIIVPFLITARSGDLSLGELNLSSGLFDLTESERAEQETAYGGFGFDLDRAGSHRIDASAFYTRKHEEVVQQKERGYLPEFDYGTLDPEEIDANADFDGFATPSAWIARSVRADGLRDANNGPLYFASFLESRSFERERDLFVYQANGDHSFGGFAEGLRLRWAANQAETTQEETAIGVRFFWEPDDRFQNPTDGFPTTPESLGPGQYAANDDIFRSTNEVEETQDFGRLDAEYEREWLGMLRVKLSSGGWWERARRNVDSSFLETPSVDDDACTSCIGSLGQFAILGDTIEELGENVATDVFRSDDTGEIIGSRRTGNDSLREIQAWNVGSKVTLWDRLDLLAGVRVEDILIESNNDPFTGAERFGAPDVFPTRYLFFDRLDNTVGFPESSAEVLSVPPDTTFNDQLLGIDVPVDPATGFVDVRDEATLSSLVNGRIDERRILPAYGFAVRPFEGLALRGAYSRTVARPSFREMGYYVSVEPGTDDLVVGNPLLVLSGVESWDARAELTWGDLGDLAAVSVFKKKIDDPIESIVIRDPLNAEGSSSALYRTFFNNPNQASLRGIEAEMRKSFDFLGLLGAPEFLSHLSVGGNFTYIDAEVDRIEAELARAAPFFGTAAGDREEFSELSPTRRLFGQPEWIFNADVSFDHPDWGTKATLAFFAISDVLDAAGSASLNANNDVISFTPDRYVDSYHQLDLVLSQDFAMPWELGKLTLKTSVKNLTDSTRRIVYDPDQTAEKIAERRFKVGLDYSFSIGWSLSF